MGQKRSINFDNAIAYVQGIRADRLAGLHEALGQKLAELGLEPNKRATASASEATTNGNIRGILRWIEGIDADLLESLPEAERDATKQQLLTLHATVWSRCRNAGCSH